MRHRKNFNHLSRKSAHRKAMLANMATSLIIHKRISTTTAKAKALKMYIEPLITKSKEDTTHSRRVVFSYLKNKDAVSELFRDVSVKIANRPGGYTRILKTGTRLGDNADMCIIELVDYNEGLLAAKEESKEATGKRRRRRRGSGSGSKEQAETQETNAAAEQTNEVKEEDVAKDAEVVEEKPKADAAADAKEETSAKAETREEPNDEKSAEEPKNEDTSEEEKK
ncbi:MAG: 50S ribosomal protein L17 [Bacteroidota bacterium]